MLDISFQYVVYELGVCWLVMHEVNGLRIGVGGGGYWEEFQIKVYLHVGATNLIH